MRQLTKPHKRNRMRRAVPNPSDLPTAIGETVSQGVREHGLALQLDLFNPETALQKFLASAKAQCLKAMLPDGRMDTETAAAYLGYAPKTLANWRPLGMGPRFVKLGRIFYFRADLDDWIVAHGRASSTAQARRAKEEGAA
jgi:hypothetical protein